MSIALALAALSLSAAELAIPTPFGQPLAAAEMAALRGTALPTVGVELSAPQTAAIAQPPLTPEVMSNQIRDMTDNWTLAVAIPLIAQATSAGLTN